MGEQDERKPGEPSAEELSAGTTDADRTASAEPEGEIDESGEDEQVDQSFIGRALDAPPEE